MPTYRILAVLLICLPAAPSDEGKDPLPSGNQGPSKKAILDFVAPVTEQKGPDFVPMEERGDIFDKDGTLGSEPPFFSDQPPWARWGMGCLIRK
jgi:hypothetical protein